MKGDLNGDGYVDCLDVELGLVFYGDRVASFAQAAVADANGDGVVDGSDLSILLSNYGHGTQPNPPNACATQPPADPTNLTLSAITASGFAASWSPAAGADGYLVTLNGNPVAVQAATNYTFTGLSCGTTYTVAVEAYNSDNNHAFSNQVASSVDTVPCDPSGVTLDASVPNSLTLNWAAQSGVTGYNVYLDGALVTSTSSTSYTASSLTCGTLYTLAVSAYNSSGESGRVAMTPSAPGC